MEIKLEFVTGKDDKGKDKTIIKTFVANKTKAILVRRATEIEKEVDFSHFTPETLDIAVDFICQIYNNQFSRDELYNGLESEKLFSTYTNSVEAVIHGVTNRLATFPAE